MLDPSEKASSVAELFQIKLPAGNFILSQEKLGVHERHTPCENIFNLPHREIGMVYLRDVCVA